MDAPVPGWYADPQDARLLRWWTGTTWTDQTAPAPAPVSTHPPLARSWSWVAVAVQLALAFYIGAAAFVFYVDVQVLAFVEEVRERPETITVAQGERVDRLLLLSSLELVPLLLTGVLFVVWLYTAHHSSRMHRPAMRHGSGWAVGGWVVPVLSLWRPYQMVTDVRRGATGRSHVATSPLQALWWAAFLAVYVANGATSALYDRSGSTPVERQDEYVDALAAAASWERVNCVTIMVAAVLAILLVRQVTALVRTPPDATA